MEMEKEVDVFILTKWQFQIVLANNGLFVTWLCLGFKFDLFWNEKKIREEVQFGAY